MADITEVDFIWKNGELVPWAEATTHVLSHSLHYGSGVFEGLRCYKDPDSDRSFVFRLRDHMSSAKPPWRSSARTSWLAATFARWSTAGTV